MPTHDRPVEPEMPTVLVVDDDSDTLDMLSVCLRMAGFETLLASNGQAALAVAGESRPSAVLTDIGLPDIDGYELCRRLRARVLGDGVPILAMTGWVRPADVERALAAGCNAVLPKPCDLEQVVGELQRLIARSRAARVRGAVVGVRADAARSHADSVQARAREVMEKARETQADKERLLQERRRGQKRERRNE